jgi:hypothetical protein
VQLYRCFVSQSSEFCLHNHLCCFSTSNTKDKCIFRYRLSPETFGYTLVLPQYPLNTQLRHVLTQPLRFHAWIVLSHACYNSGQSNRVLYKQDDSTYKCVMSTSDVESCCQNYGEVPNRQVLSSRLCRYQEAGTYRYEADAGSCGTLNEATSWYTATK